MPTVQKVHIDKMLTNISIGYTNEQYISDKIFKAVPVAKQSDKYYVHGMEKFRQHDDLRAPGTEANEINWTLSDDQFYTEGHALRTAIPDEEKQNADDIFDLETEGTELITEGVLLNREVDAANLVMNAQNYHTDLRLTMGTGGTFKWSDYENSNPVMDIHKAKEKLHKKAGIRPNTLIMSEQVMNVLKMHPALLDIIKYVQKGIVTEDLMKTAFGVDNILVGSALKSDVMNPGQVAANGVHQGFDNLDYIWGNSVVLAYIAPKPGRKTVSLGYEFQWNKDGNGAVQVRKWYETGRRATVIEAERWYAHKMISNVAGFMFADAIAPFAG
jgi:hypothetical protein